MLNGYFALKMMTSEEKKMLMILIFPDTKVLAAFIAVVSGGFYMKTNYEVAYTQNTTLVDII